MRIASNKVEDMISFYQKELKDLYEPSELNAVIQVCFAHYLNFSSTDLLTRKKENINQSDLIKLYDCCLALKKNIPVQYVLGETHFFGLNLKVNQHVLIPRPETEELVEHIVNDSRKKDGNLTILDIGTGSGCIAISLKKSIPDADVFAIDISQEALEVAQKNAQMNLVPVIFSKVDILSKDAELFLDSYDVIVSNPPYISQHESADMNERVKDHEPHLALFAEGDDPTIFYKRIIELCERHLNSQGILYFELNPIYAEPVKDFANTKAIFTDVKVLSDMSGNQRFFKAIKK